MTALDVNYGLIGSLLVLGYIAFRLWCERDTATLSAALVTQRARELLKQRDEILEAHQRLSVLGVDLCAVIQADMIRQGITTVVPEFTALFEELTGAKPFSSAEEAFAYMQEREAAGAEPLPEDESAPA